MRSAVAIEWSWTLDSPKHFYGKSFSLAETTRHAFRAVREKDRHRIVFWSTRVPQK